MGFDRFEAINIPGYPFFILVNALIPFLTFLAFRGWANHLRRELPKWRVVLSLASVLLTFVDWLAFVLFIFADRNGFLLGSMENWAQISVLTAIVSAILGLAAKGQPRIQAVTAAFLMATTWIVGAVRDHKHMPMPDQVPAAKHYSECPSPTTGPPLERASLFPISSTQMIWCPEDRESYFKGIGIPTEHH